MSVVGSCGFHFSFFSFCLTLTVFLPQSFFFLDLLSPYGSSDCSQVQTKNQRPWAFAVKDISFMEQHAQQTLFTHWSPFFLKIENQKIAFIKINLMLLTVKSYTVVTMVSLLSCHATVDGQAFHFSQHYKNFSYLLAFKVGSLLTSETQLSFSRITRSS